MLKNVRRAIAAGDEDTVSWQQYLAEFCVTYRIDPTRRAAKVLDVIDKPRRFPF